MANCEHGNRLSECQQCADEIPAFLKRQEPSELATLRAQLAEVTRERDGLRDAAKFVLAQGTYWTKCVNRLRAALEPKP